MTHRLGHRLREIDLLVTVRQRLVIPGGTCNFDLPAYHHWLQQPAFVRQQNIATWFNEFSHIEAAVTLALELLRATGHMQSVCAQDGFFQLPLDPSQGCQLVRLMLPKDQLFFPEISGGRHRISIRFLQSNTQQMRPTQLHAPVEFALSCCVV